MKDIPPDVEEWLRKEIREGLAKKLAEAPWWCLICGEGGNYEGERPELYWFPPEDHVCPPAEPPGLPMLRGLAALYEEMDEADDFIDRRIIREI